MEEENQIHMLTVCPILRPTCSVFFSMLKKELVLYIAPHLRQNIFNNRLAIVELIIDCRNYSDLSKSENKTMEKIENIGRDVCYALHVKRLQLLNVQND